MAAPRAAAQARRSPSFARTAISTPRHASSAARPARSVARSVGDSLVPHAISEAPSAATSTAHPLDDLSTAEIAAVAAAVRAAITVHTIGNEEVRFNYITLAEPEKKALLAFGAGSAPPPPRAAEVLVSLPAKGASFKAFVALPSGAVTSMEPIPDGCQPLFSPDDCDMAVGTSQYRSIKCAIQVLVR
jgi:Cu2+-containing amine oxidase